MHYSIVRLRGARVAAVLVEPAQINSKSVDELVSQLQSRLQVGVMLVARDQAAFNGVRGYAHFEFQAYLFSLLASENIDWIDLPDAAEAELPF